MTASGGLMAGLEQHRRELPDPAAEPTITVPRAAAIIDVGIRSAYAAVERGEWPAIRVGRTVRIPTARWLAAVGLSTDDAARVTTPGPLTTSTPIANGASCDRSTAGRAA